MQNLPRIRGFLSLTQAVLASRLGVSQQSIVAWESGGGISRANLETLAGVLRCKVGDLYDEGLEDRRLAEIRLAFLESETERARQALEEVA